MDSILTSIKKMLGIEETYEHFDQDIIININSAMSILTQLGIGPETGFSIRDKTTLWSDYLPANTNVEMVKTYIYLKVKLVFDPPTSSAVLSSYERIIAETEWRISASVDEANMLGLQEDEIGNIIDEIKLNVNIINEIIGSMEGTK